MAIDFGDVSINRNLIIPFTTAAIDGTRLGFSNLPIEIKDVRVYKEDGGQGTDQTGRTFDDNFDTMDGVHLYTLDLATALPAGFFEVGKFYWVVLYPSSETVDGRLLSSLLATFRIASPQSNGILKREKPSRQEILDKQQIVLNEIRAIKKEIRQDKSPGGLNADING